MRKLFVILLVLIGFFAKAQFPSNTFISRNFTGNTKAQWILLDSPVVNPVLDTFYARYAGTQIVRIQGGDTAFWFYGGGRRWFRSLLDRDTISLSNRINLKLNISDTSSMLLPYLRKADTTNKWVQDVYVRSDSLFKFKNGIETFLDTLGGGGGGSGTVTSVALSMPSAFTVTGSPITGSGTFSVSGAGTTAQYIRGNGTLATTDTTMIPSFHLKVRSLFSATSPLTYNSTTGIFGVGDANTAGTKGVATFSSSSFSDNGLGTISLADVTTAGPCINCDITFDAKGRAISFASGTPPQFVNAPGAGDTLSVSDTLKRLNPGFGILHAVTANNITQRIDTSAIATQYDLTLVNNGLSKNGDTTQFGQTVSAAGNPAALHHNTEIPLNGFNTVFTGTGSIGMGTGGPSSSIKLTVVASGSNGGMSVSTGSGTAINATTSGNAIVGQSTGSSFTGVMGSTGSGGYGVQGSGGIGGIGGKFYATAAGGDASPVALELERQPTGAGVTNGAGFTIMFRNAFTNGTTGNESGRITNYFSNAVSGSQSSEFGFHLVNNTVSARKALLAATGQWTWDGYPALTQQTDTTNIKPIGYNITTGLIQPMASWIGSGGGGAATLTQNTVGDSLGVNGGMSVRVQEVANDNNNPCYWCDITLSLPKSKLAYIQDTFATVSDSTHLNIFIGPGTHSYGEDYSRYQKSIVDLLLPKYEFAGPGLFSGNMSNYQFSPVTGWTLRTLLTTPKGRGLAGQSLLSTATDITIASGTNFQQNSYNSYQDIIILTYDTVTGGSFSITVDGNILDTINTALGTGLTSHAYHLPANVKHTIVLHEVTTGTTRCELLDMYLYTSNKRGIIVNKSACGSTDVLNWTAQPAAMAVALLQAIPGGPDLIISDLGVNNQNHDIDTNVARIAQDTLIKRWRVANPNVGIILMKGTQYSFDRYGTPAFSTSSYNRQLDQLARVDSVATFDNDKIVGVFPRSLTIGTMSGDSLHPTSQAFYTIDAEWLTNIGAFNVDVGRIHPNLFEGPDSSHVSNPVGVQRYTIWDVGTWKNKGLNHFIMQNSAGTQSLDADVTSINQVNYTSQGGSNTVYSWDGAGVFASTIKANGVSGINQIVGRLYIGSSGGTENIFIRDALSKGYTDVAIHPSASNGYAWLKFLDDSGNESGRIIVLGSAAGIGGGGTAFENSAFALTAQLETMNIGTIANKTFRIFTGGSATTNVRMSITGTGAVTLNNGSSSYTLPSARASAGQVLTDVGGTGTLTWETPSSSGNTIYTGDGTLSGNRTVTGSSNSLTFNSINTFTVNATMQVLAKNDGTKPFTGAILSSANYFDFAYTPVAGIYSKGAGIVIDSNNNVGIGTVPSTTNPLYTTGNSAFLNGMVSQAGNFYRVDQITSNQTIGLTQNFFNIDATSGNITLTLPAASSAFGGSFGLDYIFKRVDNSGNTVTIQRAGSDTIDGATSFTLTTQWESKSLRATSSSTWNIY